MAPVANPELAKLELEAYTAVLRAFAAQQMNWAREKLLSEMRRELHISSDMHISITDKVMNDEELTAIRDGKPMATDRRSTGGAHTGEKRGRPARGRTTVTAETSTPASAPRRTDSRRRDTNDFETPKEPLERSFAATGSGARNRSKRKAQPAAPEPPYAVAKLDAALANGTQAELETMRDALAKRAAQIFADILSSVAPQIEYPDEETRLKVQLQELNSREQSLRRRLEASA